MKYGSMSHPVKEGMEPCISAVRNMSLGEDQMGAMAAGEAT
jgi:hypothetical protein